MKDFFKIFFVLVLTIASFLFGKNYGETNFKNSEEYLNILKNKENDLKPAVASDPTESTEVNTDIEVIQNQQEFKTEEKNSAKEIVFDIEKYKTFEWLLINAETKESALRALNKLRLKNLDGILKDSNPASPEDFEEFLGSYRGNIIGDTGIAFGSLVINLKKSFTENGPLINGEVLVYRDGKEIIGNHFDSAKKGLKITGSSCVILDSQKNYYQIYKLKNTGQLAGYFYERLVNGSTKVIGVFALNRVDQF